MPGADSPLPVDPKSGIIGTSAPTEEECRRIPVPDGFYLDKYQWQILKIPEGAIPATEEDERKLRVPHGFYLDKYQWTVLKIPDHFK